MIVRVTLIFAALMAAGTMAQPQGEQDLVARARGIHERVITLDTHNDIDPQNFTRGCNYTMRLTNQVNLPKMKEGGLDVSFMIVYVGQSNPPQVADAFQPAGYARAYKAASEKFDAVHHLTEEIAPNEIELALTAADVTRIAKSGKKVAVIGIENGYPVGTDINRVKEFWQRGGRYMSLAHNGHSQLSDSNTGEADGQWRWGGLSPLGRQVIQEMNKWGIMVDVSHPSKGSMMQAIGLSKAPVIASHSSVRKLANHSRNMDDEMLMAMKTNGGVVQMVALSGYVKADPAERGPAIAALRQEFALPGGRGGLDWAQAGGPAAARRRPRRDAAVPGRRLGRRPRRSGPRRPRWCDRRRGHADAREARGVRAAPRRDRSQVAGRGPRDRQGLRRSHRLCGQADWHRSRRHLVGLRRRRRHRRLEQRRRDVQRHAGDGAPRLHRGANRQDLERESASRLGRSREGREGDPGGKA